MTIFSGVPLLKMKKRYWCSMNWWLFAPNVPAFRCPECLVVIFNYDNDESENPSKERIACIVLGIGLAATGLASGTMGLLSWFFIDKVPWFFLLIFGLFSTILLVLGILFLRHSFRIARKE